MTQTLQDIYWGLGTFVFIVFCGLVLIALLKLKVWMTIGLAVAIAIAMRLIPFGWLTAHDYAGSGTGPLSAAFWVVCFFCGWAMLAQRPVVRARDEAVFTAVICIAGVALYASTLGFMALPVYPMGFDVHFAAIAGGVILAIAVVFRSLMLAIWIGAGSALWLAGVIDSRNVFDYFMDPVGWLVATILFATHLAAWFGRPVPFRGLRMSSRYPHGAA